VEQQAADIVQKEVQLVQQLDSLRRDLSSRPDFSTYGIFRNIDKYSQNELDSYLVGQFLKNQGHYASERELLNIVRRIDEDGD